MASRNGVGLSREQLVIAAFLEIEEVGLEKLSMRRLAARLHVQASALYWHVREKAELLGLMATVIYAEAEAAVPSASDWRGWLADFGRALRFAIAARREGALLCAQAKPLVSADPLVNAHRMAAPLVELGLDRTLATSYRASVTSFTVGWAVFEANGPMHDFPDGILDFSAGFELGLDALVRGFEA